jgi:uncharacterized protein involved in type VI secretion and phage assembly
LAPLAGKTRGFFFLPDVDDQVLVAFEHGDVTRPYVLGAVWSGTDLPPTDDANGRDRVVLRSRSGHMIRLDDTDGGERIEIIGTGGKDTIVIDAAANTVTIATDKDIALKAPQGKIQLEATDVEVKASGSFKAEAAGTMTLKGATVNIN